MPPSFAATDSATSTSALSFTPSPRDISIFASRMSEPDSMDRTSEITSLAQDASGCQYMTVPWPSDLSGLRNVPGLTVAIWGYPMHWMSAISVPPKAGLVMMMSLPSARRPVQSAVRPDPSMDASLGASSLPREVAPTSISAGEILSASRANENAYDSGA